MRALDGNGEQLARKHVARAVKPYTSNATEIRHHRNMVRVYLILAVRAVRVLPTYLPCSSSETPRGHRRGLGLAAGRTPVGPCRGRRPDGSGRRLWPPDCNTRRKVYSTNTYACVAQVRRAVNTLVAARSQFKYTNAAKACTKLHKAKIT